MRTAGRAHLTLAMLVAALLGARPAAAGLIAYYKFDDPANLGRDYGPAASTPLGTYYNATNSGVGSIAGWAGLAGDFDGGDDYLRLRSTGRLDSLQAKPYTLTAWVYANNVPPGSGSANNANYGIINKAGWHEGPIYQNTQRFRACHWLTGDVGADAVSTNTFAPANWRHVAMVVDPAAGTNQIYVNGALEGTYNFTPGTPTRAYGTTTWTIGNANPGAGTYRWCMNGRIDEAALFDHALTGAEIAQLASGAITPLDITSGALQPAGMWRFEGPRGDPIVNEPNVLNPGTLDGTGESGATYAAWVPDRRILDPISGTVYANYSSLNMAPGAVRVLNDAALQSSSFTVEAFLRIGGDQGSYPAYVSRNMTVGGQLRGWQMDIDPSENARTRFDTAAAQNQVVSAGALGVGGWNHVALTFDGATRQIRLYRNYVNVGVGTLNGDPNDITGIVADLLMGRASGWPAYTFLDEVRFTPQVLDPPQFLRGTSLPVTYQIRVGSSGTATINATYVAENLAALGVGMGSPTAVSGSGTATIIGSVPLRPGATDYVQLVASGLDSTSSAPWLAATFTAPLNYIFNETGNQYLTSEASSGRWRCSTAPWGGMGGGGGDGLVYQVTSPNPAIGTGFAPGTQAIWGQDFIGNILTPVYLDAPMTLVQGAWTAYGSPLPSITQTPGISAHIVRVDSNLDNLAQVDAALALRPGMTNHSVSQVTSMPRADLDLGGNYGVTGGLLPGDQHSTAANPEDYAVRLAGYIYAPTAGYAHTFAVSGDNRFYFKVGDTEFVRSEAVVSSPLVAAMVFPTAGYWPFELVWANRNGAGNLELSSRAGTWYTWDSTNFLILGTDPSFPVYQRPDGVPAPGQAGANPVSSPLYAGTISPVADGFRVQQAYPTSHGGSNPSDVQHSITFYSNYDMANVGVIETRTNMDMWDPQAGGSGNWGYNQPFPIDNRDANYNVVPAKDDNYFVTRINGLLYIDSPGVRAFTVGTDDGYFLRVGGQVLGRITGGRGVPSGTANYVYGYFPAAGLYPFEFYSHEGSGGSGIEIGHGGTTSLLLASTRNPASPSNGFTSDFSGVAYRAEPVAQLQAYSTTLQGKAYVDVPALGIQVNPERWILLRPTPDSVPGTAGLPIQGLRGTYYDFAYKQTVDNTWPPELDPTVPVLGRRNDLATVGSVFNFGGGFASPLVPSRPGSPTNPAGANDYFGVRWQGFLIVPRTGLYSFQMQADDRGWMFIDIDGDYFTQGSPGYKVFEAGEFPAGQPVVWSNWLQWNNVYLTEGLHWVEFRSREWAGGETATFQWMMPEGGAFANIPAEYFLNVQDWEVLAYGSGSIGDALNFADIMDFDYDSTQNLRLVVQVAGLTAYVDGTYLFVPEPGTIVLLAGGLLAVAARRRGRHGRRREP